MRLKACLNGGRSRAEHPAVPVTATELARAAQGAVKAGAEAVHVHPRDAGGAESLAAADIGPAVRAVRASCPRTPIGVSTGLWIADGDPALRSERVAAWAGLPTGERPDFASVNVSEPGFVELATLLATMGIAVEPGVWSVRDAEVLSTVDGAWERVLVELIDVPAATAVAAAEEILDRLDAVGVVGPRLLHGEGDACWPLVAHAGRRGLTTRIGLEDTLVAPGGGAVRDNAELVRWGLERWTSAQATGGGPAAPGAGG
jgi:uncharacterized protein (DUF849 family)